MITKDQLIEYRQNYLKAWEVHKMCGTDKEDFAIHLAGQIHMLSVLIKKWDEEATP